MMFPVFARRPAKASQNNCLSNVKQIQLGLIMYASDNNQMYPPASADKGVPVYWPTTVYPYIKNTQIYLCPSDAVATGSIVLPAPNNPTNISYGRNSFMGTPGFSDATCKYPAEMLGVIDAVAPSLNYEATLTDMQAQIVKDGLITNTRHNNGCNQSYMDGHVKWIAFDNIPGPPGGSPPPGSAAKHYWQGSN
jgi:prepilin-type processing-associated H-X9-DG protein